MEILLVLSALACSYFFITSYMLYKQNQVLKIAIMEEVAKRNLLTDKDTQIVQENFLKFVSDSREWAFEYIEEVQKGLKNFVDSIDNEINYFDKYGEVIWTPLSKSMQKISIAYKDLKKLLPEESNNDKT